MTEFVQADTGSSAINCHNKFAIYVTKLFDSFLITIELLNSIIFAVEATNINTADHIGVCLAACAVARGMTFITVALLYNMNINISYSLVSVVNVTRLIFSTWAALIYYDKLPAVTATGTTWQMLALETNMFWSVSSVCIIVILINVVFAVTKRIYRY